MTKRFTVTGSSATRPTDLPVGFEVEETEDVFERRIGASNDEDDFAFKLTEEYGSLAVRITKSIVDGDDRRVFVKTEQVVKLRDALTEWLDDAVEPAAPTAPAVVNHGDPEPPRDAVYVDTDGDLWTFSDRRWGYSGLLTSNRYGSAVWDYVQSEYLGCFPWRLKTA